MSNNPYECRYTFEEKPKDEIIYNPYIGMPLTHLSNLLHKCINICIIQSDKRIEFLRESISSSHQTD